jgi:hypothetical protein
VYVTHPEQKGEGRMNAPSLFAENTSRPAAPAEAPTRGTLHIEHAAIGLPGARTLRVGRVDDELVLSDGFGEESPLRAIARGLWVPVEQWPTVRRALDELAGA